MAFGVTNRRTGILTPVVPDSTPDQASDPTLGLDRIASLSPIRLQVRPGAKTSSSNIDPIHHCAYTHIQAQTQKQTLNTTILGDKRQPSTFYSGPRHRPRSFPAEPKLRRPKIFAQTFSPRQVETFSLSLSRCITHTNAVVPHKTCRSGSEAARATAHFKQQEPRLPFDQAQSHSKGKPRDSPDLGSLCIFIAPLAFFGESSSSWVAPCPSARSSPVALVKVSRRTHRRTSHTCHIMIFA